MSGDRDNFFEDVAPVMRDFIDRLLTFDTIRGEAAVGFVLLREVASFSRVADRITVSRIAKLTGQHGTHIARALRHFDELGAVTYKGGRPGSAGWISLRAGGKNPGQLPIMNSVSSDQARSLEVTTHGQAGDHPRSLEVTTGGHLPRSLSEKVPEKKTIADDFEATIAGLGLFPSQVDRARGAYSENASGVRRVAAVARREGKPPGKLFHSMIESGQHLLDAAGQDARANLEAWWRVTGRFLDPVHALEVVEERLKDLDERTRGELRDLYSALAANTNDAIEAA